MHQRTEDRTRGGIGNGIDPDKTIVIVGNINIPVGHHKAAGHPITGVHAALAAHQRTIGFLKNANIGDVGVFVGFSHVHVIFVDGDTAHANPTNAPALAENVAVPLHGGSVLVGIPAHDMQGAVAPAGNVIYMTVNITGDLHYLAVLEGKGTPGPQVTVKLIDRVARPVRRPDFFIFGIVAAAPTPVVERYRIGVGRRMHHGVMRFVTDGALKGNVGAGIIIGGGFPEIVHHHIVFRKPVAFVNPAAVQAVHILGVQVNVQTFVIPAIQEGKIPVHHHLIVGGIAPGAGLQRCRGGRYRRSGVNRAAVQPGGTVIAVIVPRDAPVLGARRGAAGVGDQTAELAVADAAGDAIVDKQAQVIQVFCTVIIGIRGGKTIRAHARVTGAGGGSR